MTEEYLLDRAEVLISKAVRMYIDRNDQYSFDDMMIDIRAEVQRAMEDARREVLRGN